ncbi:sulfite exporter TauE/SafE family protein [Uliginosibacterium sp. H1]|uniref:sulfite exporter TauE/SafE family protein n=1 Tax=Uliginosibacterium sp. H1 TaxID=3114757 RepID=UPI002E18FCFC|nr:sulfite exporter TauE/SafE family protein [Uliginosibacterium sp. H1]
MLESAGWWSPWLLGYGALGLFSGFMAGLFGIGGGVVIVSLLAMMFTAQGFAHEHILHLALGTSMATIVFTSLSSLRAHQSHGAIEWPLVRQLTPGVIAGTFIGTLIAARISTRALALFFGFFVLLVAIQMAANLKPRPSRTLPGPLGVAGVGTGIGAVSALVAIGGGAMTVPWLSWCNLPLQRAIGTSAAMGFPIAVFGSLGYLWNGVQAQGLPTGSVGYLYIPALVCLMAASVLTAPLGARMAHRLPVLTLKRAFAVLLVVLAAKMLWGVWQA